MEDILQPLPVTKREYAILSAMHETSISDVHVLARILKTSKDTVRYNMFKLMSLGLVSKKNNGYVKTGLPYIVSNKQISSQIRSKNPHIPYWEFIEDVPKEIFEYVRRNLTQNRSILAEQTDLPRLKLNFVIMYFIDFGKK